MAGIGDNIHSAFLLSFLSRLGDLASSSCLLAHCLDATHSDRPSHVTHSKMAHRRTVREALDTRGLTRSHIDNGSNARFQGSRAIFQLFPRRTINLLQLSKLASSVSRVSIQHRCTSSTGLAWMVQNKPPSREASASHRFAAPRRVAMTSIFDRRALAAAAALSPGRASRGFTCVSADFTPAVTLTAAKVTATPGVRTPVSRRPPGTVPMPPTLQTSWRGKRRCPSVGRVGGRM